jgi:hypothetical protein
LATAVFGRLSNKTAALRPQCKNIRLGGTAATRSRQKKPGRSAPEQQRQEENGDAAALASHVPNIQTSELPASSKNFFGTFTAGF